MDRDLIYIGCGLLIIIIFSLKPDLLIRQDSFKLILAISSVEFLLGIALHFTAEAHSAAGALLAPLPTLAYFRLCLKAFLKLVHREPIDVVYNWNPGLFKDRVFAFAFLIGGMFICAGVEKLARVGW